MHIFYVANIEDLFLDRKESHHCTKVLRLKENDEIILIDGKGTLAKALIRRISDKKTEFSITEKNEDENTLSYNLHLAVAPTKNMSRFEWFIEKATEIGTSEITPILCENSERKVIKTDRLKNIIISASKQSQRACFPILNEMVSFHDFLKKTKEINSSKLIAYCAEGEKVLLNQIKLTENILVCVGPEGDFSMKEIQKALLDGFKTVTFGKSRLRTETAAIYACSAINLLLQNAN